MGAVPLFAAFLAGLLSFVSPCVLPLTPVYIARLVGPSIWEGQQSDKTTRAALRRATTLHAAAFVLGFTLTFIALGATASELGAFLSERQLALREIGGVLLVILGAHVAGLIRIPGLNLERRFSVQVGQSSYAASLLIGLIFALGWTPCVGPILASILVIAAQSQGLGAGVLLLAIYSLGLGLPFLALGLAFDRLAPLLKRLTPHLRAIELVTGGLLAFMGVAIFFNWLFVLNSLFGGVTLR
ncbi:MAG TPA: cytochrome c biogenesis protein CcdA [Ktedonobacterales bacterium]|jgi:cytochrome c-type biogenesis protein|nr:cytochrome c biogenesis protein CcdA [Ktedonobacterales bacterium]